MAGAAGAGAAVAGAGGAGAGRAVTVRADHLTPLHSHTVHLLFCTGTQRIIIISFKEQWLNSKKSRGEWVPELTITSVLPFCRLQSRLHK